MKCAGLIILALSSLLAGCAEPEFNRTPTSLETDSLADATRLTFDLDRATEAYFSHDLNWIIFQGIPRKQQHVGMFVAQFHRTDPPTIGTPIQISPANSRNTCGYFSPDGNSLIFASAPGIAAKTPAVAADAKDQRFPADMEIVRVDGWAAAAAGLNPGDAISVVPHPITRNNAYDAEGSYSPDGKWIAFTSFRTGDADVYVMHPDGSHVVQITKSPGLDGDAFFSPDGKRLVYRSDRQQNGIFQIFVATLAFDAAGEITGMGSERQLTHEMSISWQPFWHPDGRHIVYATNRHGIANDELYLMRDDGSHKTRLTFSPALDRLPAISGDGKYLMWTSTRTAERTPQIFVAQFRLPAGS